MALFRTQIRQAVKVKLDAATSITAPVYDTHIMPFHDDGLPAINIFTARDQNDTSAKAYHPVHHKTQSCDLQVEVIVGGNHDSLGVTIDDLCEQVMAALGNNLHLDGTVTRFEYRETTFQMSGKQEEAHAIASLMYQVDYVET